MVFNKFALKKYALLSFAGMMAVLFISLFIPVSSDILYRRIGFSYEIYDRNGILMRKGLSSEGYYFAHVNKNELPHYLVNALILAEDKNFFSHLGVDLGAFARSLSGNILPYQKVSGGSTITMQIARNIYSLKRNIFSKLMEIWLALRLELTYNKSELLRIYFDTIPFGKQIIGINMAARIYFNKPVKNLSVAEAAYLVAMVKYPVNVYHVKSLKKIQNRQRYILSRLIHKHCINRTDYEHALKENIQIKNFKPEIVAPHFTDFLISELKQRYGEDIRSISRIYTTIDLNIQKKAEEKARHIINQLKSRNVSNASVVVMGNDNAELLAMVGSMDYFRDKQSGQVNGAIAMRSPGSTLKPFLYATAIENRQATPATIIPDIRTRIRSQSGDYIPVNHSRNFHGPITLRQALANSFNIPAARMIAEISVTKALEDMRKNGFSSLKHSAAYYGATLALGGADVSLYELARAYLTLSHNGVYREVRVIKSVVNNLGKPMEIRFSQNAQRVYSPQTAYLISHILSDNKARETSFSLLSPLNLPFYCAAKTGTSKGYRNIWTVGYSRHYTVAVWVGNFDNSPMRGVGGITGAGAIFRSIMLSSEFDYDYKPVPPPGIVKKLICPVSGKLPGNACHKKITEYFIEGTEPRQTCNVHYSVPFTQNGRTVVFIKKEDAIKYPGIRWETLTILPPIYHDWLEAHNIRLPDSQVMKYIGWIKGKYKEPAGNVKIIFPDNGNIFALDPILDERYQQMVFRALVPGKTRSARWILNDNSYPVTDFPYSLKWQLQRGEHRLYLEVITVSGETLRSKPVQFTVR